MAARRYRAGVSSDETGDPRHSLLRESPAAAGGAGGARRPSRKTAQGQKRRSSPTPAPEAVPHSAKQAVLVNAAAAQLDKTLGSSLEGLVKLDAQEGSPVDSAKKVKDKDEQGQILAHALVFAPQASSLGSSTGSEDNGFDTGVALYNSDPEGIRAMYRDARKHKGGAAHMRDSYTKEQICAMLLVATSENASKEREIDELKKQIAELSSARNVVHELHAKEREHMTEEMRVLIANHEQRTRMLAKAATDEISMAYGLRDGYGYRPELPEEPYAPPRALMDASVHPDAASVRSARDVDHVSMSGVEPADACSYVSPSESDDEHDKHDEPVGGISDLLTRLDKANQTSNAHLKKDARA